MPIDLIPNGGFDYQTLKSAAQEISNDLNDTVTLWFNVREGQTPEEIKPETTKPGDLSAPTTPLK